VPCPQEHYAGLFTTVRFGHHYGRAGDDRKPKSKAEICADLGATMLIDDSLIYALQCSQTLEHVLLFDYQASYPWNKLKPALAGDDSAAAAVAAALPANVHRVHSWEEALQVFAKLHTSDASA
jgi:hypothetical protein